MNAIKVSLSAAILLLAGLAAMATGNDAENPSGTADTPPVPAAVITFSDGTQLHGALLGAEDGVMRVVVDGREQGIPLQSVRSIEFRPLPAVRPGDPRPLRVALMDIEVPKKEDAEKRLNRIGADWQRTPPGVSLERLKQFDVVYFPAGWGKCAGLAALKETYRAYLKQGGGLLMGEPDVDGDPQKAPALQLLPYAVEMSAFTGTGSGDSVVQYHKDRTHVLTEGVDAADLPYAYDLVRQYDPGWTVLAKTSGTPGTPTLLVAEVGSGRVVLHTNPDDYGHLSYFKDRFVVRIVRWLARRPPGGIRHDSEILGPRQVADFVAQLETDYQQLLAAESPQTRNVLQRAERLLRNDAQQSSTWTAYGEALQLVRRHRSKAAIAMLLKLLADDRLSHSSYQKEVYRTLVILTGRPIADDRVEQVARDWWFPQREAITVDPAQMTPQQLKVVVGQLMDIVAWGESYLERDRDGMTPYKLYHLMMYGVDAHYWTAEDFSDAMIPQLISAADDPARRFTAMAVLASLRKAERAPKLESVVNDTQVPAPQRVVAALALWKANKVVPHEVLIWLLRADIDRELKTAVIITLGHSQHPAAVETVVGYLGSDDAVLREAAVWAAYTQKSPKAVKPIAELLRKDCNYQTPGVRWAVRTLGEFKTDEAIAALADLLETTWRQTPDAEVLPELLDAFESATGQSFQHRSIPRRQPEVIEGVRKALVWWHSRTGR